MSSYHQLEKRFGIVCVEKGFITAAQLHEVIGIQINENLYGMDHRLLGQILVSLGYITSDHIREVLREMGVPTRFSLCDCDLFEDSQGVKNP
ncbi:MAG: hypothetical protein GY874_04720 [Desulfobacteraceae bacterium]|nr:hypothetical protein [Desulfobacteraceae bacterium]